MESGLSNHSAVRKESLTPKAILHKKYGTKACYKIEEVLGPSENVCPGLSIPQKVKCLYRCHLELPYFSVTSDTYTKKKDAEQCAAKLALEKLGIQSSETSLTLKDAWDELVGRISSLFKDEFLSSSHPLTNHFRVAFQREDSLGFIPLSIIIACDSKISNLCKSIESKCELDSLLIMKLVTKAAKLVSAVQVRDGGFWIGRCHPYPEELMHSLVNRTTEAVGPMKLEAVRIPCLIENPIEAVIFDISSDHYYLDKISLVLGAKDSSRVLVSRCVGKSSSEMRIYFSPPEDDSASLSTEMTMHSHEFNYIGLPANKRASYFCGQVVYGDAVLATVGYKWNHPSLFYEHVSLSTYYRMFLSRIPSESYKLSRDAMLAAELPANFTSRTNWRGSLPKELLSMFCRLHRLSEPIFTVEPIDISGNLIAKTESFKRTKHSEVIENANSENGKDSDIKPSQLSCFTCGLKIFSKKDDLLIEFIPENTYKKQTDAIQTTALKVISWLSGYFKQLDMPSEKLQSFARAHGICVYPKSFIQEFHLALSVHGFNQEKVTERCHVNLKTVQLHGKTENGVDIYEIEGPDNCNSPSQGSLVCISYSVSLILVRKNSKRILESNETFEFEIGSGSVINELETCVTRMSVNQTARFLLQIPSREVILAAAGDAAGCLSHISLYEYELEYSVKLLEVTEPLEERIEQALFSPPLSRQRVEFARKYLDRCHAIRLVDFGCGSGNLLDSLLDHKTSLEEIVGVDFSQKGLCRAAKILHARLATADSTLGVKVRSVVLYDGSITDFDSRLYGFDIGTCLEVIEHMEESQANLFGDIALKCFCPKLLIISTPNYEYNPILQGSSLSTNDDDLEEKGGSGTNCRFRNHDHKFEWTRQQFQFWASGLASRHGYSVEFSGVGGSGDMEPGFASQIAVFSRKGPRPASDTVESSEPYKTIWKWEA